MYTVDVICTSTVETNVNLGSLFDAASSTPGYCYNIDNYKLTKNQKSNAEFRYNIYIWHYAYLNYQGKC